MKSKAQQGLNKKINVQTNIIKNVQKKKSLMSKH